MTAALTLINDQQVGSTDYRTSVDGIDVIVAFWWNSTTGTWTGEWEVTIPSYGYTTREGYMASLVGHPTEATIQAAFDSYIVMDVRALINEGY